MHPNPASYRDNSGFVFKQGDRVYRYVHPRYELQYAKLMNSGLYHELVNRRQLVAHTEIAETAGFGFTNGKVLEPEQITFISYPYEWSFDMWKDAALLTLQLAGTALKKEMILKDATPFNIQFYKGKAIFIDTLSFENYEAGKPWIAYRQFCECFLAPLLLMHYCHPDVQKIFTVYPNGIPMDVLVSLLPKRSRWNMNTFLHVHLQAKLSGKQKQKTNNRQNFSRQKLDILLNGLESFVQKLSPKKVKTTWDDYYSGTILGAEYLQAKTTLVQDFIQGIDYKTVIDLGANDGHFSLLFEADKQVVATDADHNCINELYLKIKKEGRQNIIPIINDLTAPSPAIGWANAERESITNRLKAGLVLALALVHHLAIGKNVPLPLIANWLQQMGEYLIIEFVPKEDEKVKLLLQNRADIFDAYSQEHFRSAFEQYFQVLEQTQVGNTGRILFLMKRK